EILNFFQLGLHFSLDAEVYNLPGVPMIVHVKTPGHYLFTILEFEQPVSRHAGAAGARVSRRTNIEARSPRTHGRHLAVNHIWKVVAYGHDARVNLVTLQVSFPDRPFAVGVVFRLLRNTFLPTVFEDSVTVWHPSE